ncbi:MAG: substrate-binding domain-containing protein, partial [Verrucomicrobiae bacterium]|nr:substrate-binding domain-containing protein [Verrucomicrobiae bacterium]
PGRRRLAEYLGASNSSVQRALEMLEAEGLLVPQGDGKRRKIVLKPGSHKPRSLRIGIFCFDPGSKKMARTVDLKHQLIEEGHTVNVMSKTLTELGMKIQGIQRVVKNHEVDAWLIMAAPRVVLEWFAARPTPVFALWGSHLHMSIAGTGPKKTPATEQALNHLIKLGHRRIIYLVRPMHIKTPPIVALQSFIDVMGSHGIPVGSYNMPIWEEHPEGLQQCLDSLFATTPPTALIIDEAEIFLAAKDHLARRGIHAPEDVSLICTDPDRAFAWYRPKISHIAWGIDPMIRHVLRWVNKVSRGEDDRRKSVVKATFVEGGTIGPAAVE